MTNSTNPEDVRDEFRLIEQKIAMIIQKDVCSKEGLFYYGDVPPSNEEIATRLDVQCDERPFNSLKGVLPFPPKQPS